jgi:hypothetical protein
VTALNAECGRLRCASTRQGNEAFEITEPTEGCSEAAPPGYHRQARGAGFSTARRHRRVRGDAAGADLNVPQGLRGVPALGSRTGGGCNADNLFARELFGAVPAYRRAKAVFTEGSALLKPYREPYRRTGGGGRESFSTTDDTDKHG